MIDSEDLEVIDGEVVGTDEEPATGLAVLYPSRRDGILGGGGKFYQNDIWQRRQAVAVLRSRGLEPREIAEELTRIGLVNPKNHQPWTVSVVHNDLKELAADWRRNAKKAVSEHIARVLAELQEVKRAAWSRGDLTSVLLAIDRECKLLGLYSPQTVNLVLKERAEEIAKAAGVDPAALIRAAQAISERRLP